MTCCDSLFALGAPRCILVTWHCWWWQQLAAGLDGPAMCSSTLVHLLQLRNTRAGSYTRLWQLQHLRCCLGKGRGIWKSQKTSVYVKLISNSPRSRGKLLPTSADSMEDVDLRGRLTQGKGDYEIKALDMVLERPEHCDLTVLFRAVPSKFGNCFSA